MDARLIDGNALCRGQRALRVEPTLDRLSEQWSNLLVALEGPAVEREEEALEVALGGIGDEAPHVPDHPIGRLGRRGHRELPELCPRTSLHRPHHLDQEATFGAEVVEEHPMAGPDGGGNLAQAHVTQAVDDEVVHHLIDELLLGSPARHVPNGTLDAGPERAAQRNRPREIGGVVAHQAIEHELTAKAPPATVFALLADGSTWPSWSPLGSFELVHAGDGDPEGVGAVRVFRTGRIQSRERVVMAKPNERFSYELISGLAVRDYRATIRLQESGEGTIITWRSTFRAKVPGTGWIYRRQLSRFIGLTVNGLAAAAESQTLAGR